MCLDKLAFRSARGRACFLINQQCEILEKLRPGLELHKTSVSIIDHMFKPNLLSDKISQKSVSQADFF